MKNGPYSVKLKTCISTLFLILLVQNMSAKRASNLNILQSDKNSITFRIDVPQVNFKNTNINRKLYAIPSIPEYSLSSEPGQPALPQKAFIFGAPPNAEISLSILEAVEKPESKQSGIRIAPAPYQQVKDSVAQKLKLEYREGSIYTSPAWLPNQIVRFKEIGFMRNQRLISVIVSPVQYNPATNDGRIFSSLTVRLTFDQRVDSQFAVPFTGVRSSQKSGEQFESLLQGAVVNYEQSKSWRASYLPKSRKDRFFDPMSEYYKLEIQNDGIYQITGAELQDAGHEISVIDPSTIKIFNKGKEIPIKIVSRKDGRFDLEDAVLFYGQFNRGDRTYLSPYTKTNVYWLTGGGEKGLRMAEVEGGLFESDPSKFIQPTNFRASEHFEKDWYFDRLLLIQDEQADHWFWQRMDAFQTHPFNIQLNQPDSLGNPAKVRIALQGSTHPSVTPDHHVIVFLNDHQIGEALWDGQTEVIIENSQVPAYILQNGENNLELRVPGDTEAGEVDQVFFNWVEMEYDRKFLAVNDYLEIQCSAPGLIQFTAQGFSESEVQILDKHGRYVTNFELKNTDSGYSVTFQDRIQTSTNTYFLFTQNVLKQPLSVTKERTSNLKSIQNGADYIIITHAEFRNALLPLEQHRANQGLRIVSVDIQDIYDEFNHGIYDPRAIKAFLKYAYFNWIPPAPTYVLLVGDTHTGFDKDVAHSWGKTSFVPTYMAYTVSWGLTSSDNYFVTVSGDDALPDMFIGRLPVNSVEETEPIIDKILAYETTPNFGEWRRNLALSVGNRDFFEEHADVLDAEYVPEDFEILRLYTNPNSPYFGSTEELIEIFNKGTTILNFIGHGGGGVFFDAELFLLEDIVLLNNFNRLPIAFSWSCFIGYFDNPWTPSLGEELLRVPDKGVVAHFGSAGRAWLFGDFFFNQALFNSLFRRNQRILGRVTTEAKIELLSQFSTYRDMVENYILLGDPALKIGFPENDILFKFENQAVSRGDTLHIAGTLNESIDGTAKLSFYNEQDSLLKTREVAVMQGEFKYAEVIQDFPHGPQKVKAYFWNESTDGSGVGFFTVEWLHFSEGQLLPAKPVHLDSVHFFTKFSSKTLSDSSIIESVECQWSYDRRDWNSLTMSKFEDGFKSDLAITIYEGRTIFYRFLVKVKNTTESESDEITSRLFSYYITKRADLTLAKESVTVGGAEELLIQFQINNNGETDAFDVPVTIYELSENPLEKILIIQENVISIAAKSDTVISMKWPDTVSGSKQIEIVLDEDNQIAEISDYNNAVKLPMRFLTVSHGTNGSSFSADSNFVVEIPPLVINKNTSFLLNTIASQNFIVVESGLEPITLRNGIAAIYELTLADSSVVFEKHFKVAFKVDLSDSIFSELFQNSLISIYQYEVENRSWLPITTSIDLENFQVFSYEALKAGVYGLFLVKDNEPPSVSVKVNGQWFTDGDYVSASPTFSLVIEDSSGISLTNNGLKLLLDSEVITEQEYSYGYAGERSATVLVNYSTNINAGQHFLTIMAEDVHGNLTESTINFEISSAFQLQSIANHPNPFTDETIIAYTLTNEAESVDVKIYTVSGRLIRNFEFFNEVGYIEHVWDGTDELGNEIANGVYYMRFVAKHGSDRIETIQKLAKMK